MDEDRLSAASEREMSLWEAYRVGGRALELVLDLDALDVGPSGVLDRSGIMAAVAKMSIASNTIEEMRVVSAGDVEIVTYRSTVSGTYDGQPFIHPTNYATTVWRRSGSRWRVLHRHETPVRSTSLV